MTRDGWRTLPVVAGVVLIVVGVGLLASLLYDATVVVTALGLGPAGAEAVVVLLGLAVSGVAVALGVRYLRRSLSSSASR